MQRLVDISKWRRVKIIVGIDKDLEICRELNWLNEYALSGGKLVCNSWQMAGYSDHPLWRTLGVSFRFDSYWPDPVFWWNPTHPAFNDPEAVPEFTELLPVGYGIYGQHVEPLTGFEAVAGYTTPGPDLDQAALVIGNDGRTVFKAFADGQNFADRDADGTPDGVELWENLIAGIQKGFVPPVPWLTAEPASATQRPNLPQHVQVTVDATQLRPGTYSATLVIRHNSGRSQKLVVPVSVKVLPFKVALKAAGPAYTDNTKEEWAADQAWTGSGWGYSGSSSALSSTTPVGSTVDPKLYATARRGQFGYRFDVPAPGTYRVELRFAELQNVKPGTRVSNVRAEGNVMLPRHDIANEVGNYKADNHAFNINVGDGQLNLRFEPLAGQKLPIVNAIRVTRPL